MPSRIVFAKALASVLAVVISSFATTTAFAADFDGDGVADEFSVTRDAAKVAKEPGVRVVNLWSQERGSRQRPKGVGIVVRLTRTPQKFLIHDPEFFSSPMWVEGQRATRVVTRKDKQYRDWKKQVPSLKADAIEVGTEAGIDILLFWNGRWDLFWPQEEP